MKLYDQHTIDSLEWPKTLEGELAKKHLLPLMKEGPEAFIQNAKTRLYVLSFDEHIVPITVNEREYQNCYLLSSYFIAAQLQEQLDHASAWLRISSKPFTAIFKNFLKWMKINKVVIINNWLLSTNPYPELTQDQINKITVFLKHQFKDHYFMFRSVNTYKSNTTFQALQVEKFRMIPCRYVYLYDPTRKQELSSTVIRKQRKDTNRIANKKYTVEAVQTLSEEEIKRLLHLYRNVYVQKYTKYSPQYTEHFLRHALSQQTIRLSLLKKEGVIYGVTGFLQKNDYLLIPFFGYDTSIDQEEGLYRMLSSVIIDEVERVNLVSHQGSGAAQFKQWRGCQAHMEYVGIYDRHLPAYRRLFWSMSEKFSPFFLKKKTFLEK